MKKSLFSFLGNAVSILGVALTPQDLENIEHITAIICMVVGLAITITGSIIIPLYKWWKNAKKDGKITKEEINEGKNILQEGINDVKEVVDDNKKKGDNN